MYSRPKVLVYAGVLLIIVGGMASLEGVEARVRYSSEAVPIPGITVIPPGTYTTTDTVTALMTGLSITGPLATSYTLPPGPGGCIEAVRMLTVSGSGVYTSTVPLELGLGIGYQADEASIGIADTTYTVDPAVVSSAMQPRITVETGVFVTVGIEVAGSPYPVSTDGGATVFAWPDGEGIKIGLILNDASLPVDGGSLSISVDPSPAVDMYMDVDVVDRCGVLWIVEEPITSVTTRIYNIVVPSSIEVDDTWVRAGVAMIALGSLLAVLGVGAGRRISPG